MTIQLYQSPTSMYCEKIRIVLGMKNIPYEIVDVKKDDRKSLIAFSGQRKVPVMDFDGRCVIDSTVIAKLLEEKFPQPSIYPDGERDKSLCLMLEDWADEVLNPAITGIRRAENAEARQKAEQVLGGHLETLDHFFSGREFVFDRMTLADLAVFTQLHYLYTAAKYEVPAGYRNLHSWMDLMRRTLKLSSLYDMTA
ncbi:MAG: glutathione S-transferase family protein [Candidatus Binatia bacterium]|nr:glutathione S-transferase family protein [Candidatus Binatia bacterium]